MSDLRVAVAQINSTVGDLLGNAELILRSYRSVAGVSDLVVFPELALPGYPPEDLLLKPSFVRDNMAELRRIAREMNGCPAVVGFVDAAKGRRYNAAAWIENGRVAGVYHKIALPNYGVFDERRYFAAGDRAFVRLIKGVRVGVTICEDIWAGPLPLAPLRALRPQLTVNISASPYHRRKILERHAVTRTAARALKSPILYCNLVGGQDELIFDGGSFATDTRGRIAAQLPLFDAGVFCVAFKAGKRPAFSGERARLPGATEEVFQALILGIRDYVRKNGFERVALGISGGIDSALVAALAAEALGPERVVGVTMPSRFNVSATRKDARRLAQNLGIRFIELPIHRLHAAFLTALRPLFAGTKPNIAEENIQARVRGTLLMALSNKFGWLVLTTGNKSETSTGYCTLYGDTAGGFAVLKDLVKTTVYELARFVNRRAGTELIPRSTITRPPTAELRSHQKDEDSLGRYADLDPIVIDYVERNLSGAEIARRRPGRRTYIERITSLIDRSEYKRRQAPPGLKITSRSFGRDYRMPITNRYR